MSAPSPTTGPALRVEGLTVSYADEPVLQDVSFEARFGALMGVVGPNGAGKSTLIKAIVGALRPDAGRVEVCGSDAPRARRAITYVPQRGSVDWDFPVTVRDVVRQGRYGRVGLLGRFSRADHQIVEEALEQVGMTALAGRQIGELSGGQQQRVFLARALAQQGRVYLMDEPFVGVDARTEEAILAVLRALVARDAAVLVVHHDLSTIREYFDEILLLKREVIACGPTADVFTPEHLQRAYGGRLAIFSGEDGQTGVVVS